MALGGCEMSVTTGPCPEGLTGDASKALVLTKAYKARGGSYTDCITTRSRTGFLKNSQ